MPNEVFNYQSFFEHIPNAYCITDFDLQIIEVNKSFLKLFEVNTLSDLSLDFKSLLSKKTLETNDFSTLAALDKKQISGYLASRFNPNILINWVFTVDKGNHKVYISGEQVDDETVLQSKKTSGKVGGWAYFIETEELWWSEEVYHIHEEALDKHIEVAEAINYYYKDDVAAITKLFADALEKGISYDEELRIVTAKGAVKWVRAIGRRVLKDGKPYKVEGNFLDIHRQKLAELELEKNKILLQKILDSLPVGVFWKDKNGNYSGFNKKSATFLNTTVEALLGKKDEEIVTDKDLLARIREQDKMVLLDKKSYSETRKVALNQEQNRTIEIEKVPLINENDEVFGILGVFIDTTEMTNLVNSLKRKNNELQELLFAISHDLKEPLKGINRFSQLLQKRYHGDLGTEGNQILDYILREAHRQYLQFSGLTRFLEVGNEKKEISSLSLNDVVYEAIRNVAFDKSMSNIEINLNDAPKLNYYKYDLITVFRELITNAIKFKQSGRDLKIEISVKEGRNAWEITFSDNGEGFDTRLKDKVFMIFKKLHNKYYYEGAGIGLSICKKIIEHYGGEIKAEPTLFQGTTFNFTIPKRIVQKMEKI